MTQIRRRGMSYQADVVSSLGKRRRKSFKSLKEAEAFIRLNDISQKSYRPMGGVNMTFGPFVDQVFNKLWGHSKAPEAPRLNCDVLMERGYIPSDMSIPNIDKHFIWDMIARMQEDCMSNGTINRKLSTLSVLLKEAVSQDILDTLPLIERLKEGEGRTRVLTDNEEERAIRWFRHCGLAKDEALFNFLLYTGCRTGEARKLKRENVVDNHALFMFTKNRMDRRVPLIPQASEAWQVVSKSTNDNQPFTSITENVFRGHWRKLKDHLKVPDDDKQFVPHMLRHTCCTRLVSAGVPLAEVMKWMGHKNINTTMRYSHLAPDILKGAADALNQRGRII